MAPPPDGARTPLFPNWDPGWGSIWQHGIVSRAERNEALNSLQVNAPITIIIHANEEEQCLQSLFITSPRHDKKRIEAANGGLLDDAHRWMLKHPTFTEWRDGEDNRLLWIEGGPGTGKTMLLCGILDHLLEAQLDSASGEKQKHRVAYFLCEGSNENANRTIAVLRGLMYSLITGSSPHQPCKELLSYVLKEYKHAGSGMFRGHGAWYTVGTILIDMLSSLSERPEAPITYLLIDAVDECGADMENLLATIRDACEIPRVKWLVTSRSKPGIAAALRVGKTNKARHRIRLADHAEEISKGVRKYVDRCAKELAGQHGLEGDSSQQLLESLQKKTSRAATFLYARLIFARAKDTEPFSESLLKVLEDAALDVGGLFRQADYNLHQLDGRLQSRCRTALATMAIAFRPLHLAELCVLTEGITRDEVTRHCSSFFTVDKAGAANIVNQSAKDFLCGPETALFPGGLRNEHVRLFLKSLQAMKEFLRRDVCDKDGSPSNTAESQIFAARYACEHWMDHLHASQYDGSELDDGGALMNFFQEQFLYWLEVLGRVGGVWASLGPCVRLLNVLQGRPKSNNLASLVKDAHRFLEFNAEGVAADPLQAYVSALVFAPSHSHIRHFFSGEEPGWVELGARKELERWSPWVRVLDAGDGWQIQGSASFSSDCAWLAAVVQKGADRVVRAWDLRTGRCVLPAMAKVGCWIGFTNKGSTLAVATSDKGVWFWDAAQALHHSMPTNGSDILTAAFSPDDVWLATAVKKTPYDDVEIWHWATGDWALRFGQNLGPITSIAYSSSGRHLGTSHGEKGFLIWNAESGHILWSQELRPVSIMAFSSDGCSVVAANNKTFSTWDLHTHQLLREVNVPVQADSRSIVALSANASRYAVAPESEIRIFDPRTRLRRQTFHGYDRYVLCLEFSPDGQMLVSGGGRWLRLSSTLCTGFESFREERDHGGEILMLRASKDGTRFISVSPEKIQAWKTGKSQILAEMRPDKHDTIMNAALSPDGTRVVSISSTGCSCVWDAETGDLMHDISDETIRAACFSPDGVRVAVVLSTVDNIKIWDSGKEDFETPIFKLPSEAGSAHACISFFPTGNRLAASFDIGILIWEVEKRWKKPVELREGDDDIVRAICFSSDERKLVAASDHSIKIWELESRQCAKKIMLPGYGHPVPLMAYDDKNARLLTNVGCYDVLPNDPTVEGFQTGTVLCTTQAKGYGISPEGDWVTWDSEKVLWLPPEYRPVCAAVIPLHNGASSKSCAIVLGCWSGRVVVLRFLGDPPLHLLPKTQQEGLEEKEAT